MKWTATDELEAQLAAVRKSPIKVMVKEMVYGITFEGDNNRQALLNLNNIVNEMNPSA